MKRFIVMSRRRVGLRPLSSGVLVVVLVVTDGGGDVAGGTNDNPVKNIFFT